MIDYDEVKDVINDILDDYTFEPNDSISRNMIFAHIRSYLKPYHDHGYIYDFTIILDNENNVPTSAMNIHVFIKETEDSEAVILHFVKGN